MSTPPWVWLQRFLPQRSLCKLVFLASRSQQPWLKTPLVAWFAHHYAVDLTEAAEPELSAYASLNAFFTRALRPGARRVDSDPNAVTSPVDGRLTEFGYLEDGRLLQAKGFGYRIEDLLEEPAEHCRAYRAGAFATMYLAPHDYHRVHMPFDGLLTRARYVAGRRFAVNEATAARIGGLFCRNERLACWFETRRGTMVMVLVGALNVSSIGTVAHGEIESGRSRLWESSRGPRFAKGDEFGRFNLGSTVILLFEANSVTWDRALTPGAVLRLGTRIGSLTGERS
jgi:phosphatidylserine decarboxylase